MATIDKTGVEAGSKILHTQIISIIDAVNGWMIKHVPVTGTIDAPSEILITPGGIDTLNIAVDGVNITGVYAEGFDGKKVIETFKNAADYTTFPYIVIIEAEQEQRINKDFTDMAYPKVEEGVMKIKAYRTGMGRGYGGTDNCYCSIYISKS
jgi:hypothetical protein